MDHMNQFETPVTFRLHRLEYVVGLAVVIGLMIAHFGQIRWLPAIGLFVYIDIIGYIPGAIAYRRSPDHRIHKGFYVAYNIMHSMATQTVVAGLWLLLVRPEWALLVLPLHLFADRGIFGNFLKPFGLAFEPEPNPSFSRYLRELFAGRSSVDRVDRIPVPRA
jgi:hypothetical protein